VLHQVGSRTLSGASHGANEWVTSRFSTNESLRLTMSVTKLGSSKKLSLQKGTTLAGAVGKVARSTLSASVTHAGSFGLRAVLKRTGLQKGKTYVVHLTATNSAAKSATLLIRFRA